MAIKILRINTKYKGSGAEKTAKTLNRALNELENIKSFFAYARGKKNNKINFLRFGLPHEPYIHGFLSRVFGIEGYGSHFSSQRLLKYIKKNNFDIVHLHNIHSFCLSFSFFKKLKQLNIPVVWTFHDLWPITGSCFYPNNCKKWQTGCKNCPDKKRPPRSLISSSSFMWHKKRNIFSKNWSLKIVTPSKWLKKQVQKSFFKNKQIKVIPNAINTDLFKPRNKERLKKEFNIPQNKKVVLFVASDLSKKRKGIKYFLNSLPLIKAKNWMVLTIGKKINKNKFPKNISLLQKGHIGDRKKLAKLYSLSDLFVATPLAEIFGRTTTEALASGVPVVGFKTGGVLEQVEKDCGILVNKKDTPALASAISELLNNENKRKIISKKARKKAIQNYSIPKFRDNYLNFYKKIIKNEEEK